MIIDSGVISPVHGKKVVDGLNVTNKNSILQFMSTFKLLFLNDMARRWACNMKPIKPM